MSEPRICVICRKKAFIPEIPDRWTCSDACEVLLNAQAEFRSTMRQSVADLASHVASDAPIPGDFPADPEARIRASREESILECLVVADRLVNVAIEIATVADRRRILEIARDYLDRAIAMLGAT